MIGWEGCSPGVVFPKRLSGGVQPTSKTFTILGHSIPYRSAPTPPPTSWKAAYDTGPVRIFFQGSQQNFEPLRCKLPGQTSKVLTTKTRVSESVPPSPDSENLWKYVPFMTKICIFCYHIYDLTKNLIASL